MATEIHHLNRGELLALLAGDPELQARLEAGQVIRTETPFSYPGRQGPVVVYLGPRPEPEPDEPPKEGREGRSPKAPTAPPAAGLIRITDGGDLVKWLSEQRMELETDLILSKTVFHAVRQVRGAGVSGSRVYLDSTAETAGADLWCFLQLIAEVIGLRHSKYKDALVQLERRREAEEKATGARRRQD